MSLSDLRDPLMEPAVGDMVVVGFVARRVTRAWVDEHGVGRVAWSIEGSTTGLAGSSSLRQWRRWSRPQEPDTREMFDEDGP